MKQDETRVYLWVAGYGDDASVVTRLIGLYPTMIQVPGQPNAQFPKIISRHHLWQLHSPLPQSAHIDDHFEALLQVLEPCSEAIKAASERFQAGIISAVYYYQDFTPGIHLPQSAVNTIARMGLSVDFDLYFLKGSRAKPKKSPPRP